MENREAFKGEFDRSHPYSTAKSQLTNRVSDEEMVSAEAKAIKYIRNMADQFDGAFIGNSGGIDSIVLAHLGVRAGVTETATVQTPESFPQHIEYTEEQTEEMGAEYNAHVIDWMDIEWVEENPEYLWPEYDDRMYLAENRQRQGLLSYHEERTDAGIRLLGRRTQQNTVPEMVYKRGGLYQGFPIKDWTFAHVIKYMERHGIPVSPVYTMRYGHVLGNIPWHVRDREATGETVPECWYAVREFARNGFWTRITNHFPEGEKLAREGEATVEGDD